MRNKPVVVLGIETSCDETSLAVVRNGRLLAMRTASQVDAHAVFGGVVPELASREHLRLLKPLYESAMDDASITPKDVDVVAVARGPGLLGSLLVGVNFAKGLSLAMGADLVGVNHLHAHLLAPLLEESIAFPALGLLASGGHTALYLMHSPTQFENLGRTLDDAAGEAFDKAAKALNLPYPGGALIDRLASQGTPDTSLFTRPYIDNSNLDFSFSGLKTAFANHVAAQPHLVFDAMADIDPTQQPSAELADVCASFNWSVVDAMRIKVERALAASTQVKSLVAAGGVAANSGLRAMLSRTAAAHGLDLRIPRPGLCVDNAAMIALNGWILHGQGLFHDLDLEAVPRGRAAPDDYLQKSTTDIQG